MELWGKLDTWLKREQIDKKNVIRVYGEKDEFEKVLDKVVKMIINGASYGMYPFNRSSGYRIKTER